MKETMAAVRWQLTLVISFHNILISIENTDGCKHTVRWTGIKQIVSLHSCREHHPSECVVHRKENYNRSYASWQYIENFSNDREAYKLGNKYLTHYLVKKKLAPMIQNTV